VVGFGTVTCFADGPRARAVLLALAILGCGWSAFEANVIASAGGARRMPPDASERSFFPENRYLTRFAYAQFPGLPQRFSSGVMEPWNEFRLMDRRTGAEAGERPGPPEREWSSPWFPEGGSRIWTADSTLVLEPNKQYLLEVAFPREDYSGVLQLSGRRLYREYILPRSGQPLAFGCSRGSDHRIALRILGADREEARIRFISDSARVQLEPWTFRLWLRNEKGQGVDLKSLVPAVMIVRSPANCLVVTPRMYLAGYSATVDGRPAGVERLEHGELAVPVPSGEHTVVLSYSAPVYLAIAYWLSVGTALVGGVVAVRARWGSGRSEPTAQTR